MPNQQQTEAKNMSTPNDNQKPEAGIPIHEFLQAPQPQPQPPQGERVKNTSFAWLPYLHKAKLVSTDAQLSGDFRVIARLMQQIDALQAQRGELIAALRDIREVSANPCSVAGVVMESIGLQQFASRVFSVARAAIARATQGGQS